MKTQSFFISTKWLHPTDPLHKKANSNWCVEVQIPVRCCGYDLVVGVRAPGGVQDDLNYGGCTHYDTYPKIYANRIRPGGIVKITQSPLGSVIFTSCTKCGFEYPYGGPVVCKQCELWKAVGG